MLVSRLMLPDLKALLWPDRPQGPQTGSQKGGEYRGLKGLYAGALDGVKEKARAIGL